MFPTPPSPAWRPKPYRTPFAWTWESARSPPAATPGSALAVLQKDADVTHSPRLQQAQLTRSKSPRQHRGSASREFVGRLCFSSRREERHFRLALRTPNCPGAMGLPLQPAPRPRPCARRCLIHPSSHCFGPAARTTGDAAALREDDKCRDYYADHMRFMWHPLKPGQLRHRHHAAPL
jgi:hypothetical protein